MKISKAIVTGSLDQEILFNEVAFKMPCISYQSMRRSNRVLREFVLYYFPIYNLSINDLFRFYPILSFIEALVYQTNEEVEEVQSEGSQELQISPWKYKHKIILSVLDKFNLKHFKVDFYLHKLGDYFDLETKLLTSRNVTLTMVKKAAELRSSDYRVLHCTLLKMLGLNYSQDELNEELKLMWPLEVLNDIEDDLMSYSEDVAAKQYNTYRMFVRMYREKAAYYLRRELDYYESLFHAQLSRFSDLKREKFIKPWNAYRLDHPVPVIPEPIFED
ncbi:hypothetical protein [Iningainema tapete]|uniref:Uncharacterized protein n=1 Tax=Iningainema tapete BLCC-T55 TaxID=2748662 RepID=A0A8J6XS63_9CYAN|nr:hypothetical protein [Iningainema tapete]MBD2776526.1 hypothetical protein [Iningainema tapete BLCC-T55]